MVMPRTLQMAAPKSFHGYWVMDTWIVSQCTLHVYDVAVLPIVSATSDPIANCHM
jgi:hypothetical protein